MATETGTLSYELLLRYLTLCVSGGHDAEVSEVYDIMRGSFPSLDTGASSLFIKSFSRTKRWKEALDLLSEMKTVSARLSPKNPGGRNGRVPLFRLGLNTLSAQLRRRDRRSSGTRPRGYRLGSVRGAHRTRTESTRGNLGRSF